MPRRSDPSVRPLRGAELREFRREERKGRESDGLCPECGGQFSWFDDDTAQRICWRCRKRNRRGNRQ